MSSTEYTKEVVCPWCGHIHSDSWDFFPRYEETASAECGECDKPIRIVRHVSITYSTHQREATR